MPTADFKTPLFIPKNVGDEFTTTLEIRAEENEGKGRYLNNAQGTP